MGNNLSRTLRWLGHVWSGSPFKQPGHLVLTTPPRFAADNPDAITYLEEHGYVVIEALDPLEVDQAFRLLWEFLGEQVGMQKDDKGSWVDENFRKVAWTNSGILYRRGIGHSKFQWFCRTRRQVKLAFEKIYNTDELIVSFDGCNIFRPWQECPSVRTEGGWFHVDQGRTLRGRQCVQGLISLTDTDGTTGGFCCIPGSHKHHDELIDGCKHDGNFFKVPAGFSGLLDQQVIPKCKAGDMILWDSRTIHCSTPAIVKPTSPADSLLRVASYVCMTPRSLVSEEVIEARVHHYESNRTGTHWPHIIEEGNENLKINKVGSLSAAERDLLLGTTVYSRNDAKSR